ncbi:MAG: LysM peptidoglycan-binding domain-containing protein [Clostridia bacterium]|jgi:LysM repeat protein
MKLKGVNRKKFVKSILTIVFIFVLGFMVINSVLASNEAVETKEIEYAVCKGDTLWKIAEKYKLENQDPREYIYEVKKLNNMTSASIYEGQIIKILLVEGK